MAITKQPADDSLYSAYSQIPVETDNSTPGIEIETQNFDEDNMVSLNIIDNEEVEVIDNSGGSSNNYSVKFLIRRKAVPGEWYALGFITGLEWVPLHSPLLCSKQPIRVLLPL